MSGLQDRAGNGLTAAHARYSPPLRAAMVEPRLEGMASGDEGDVVQHLVDVLPAAGVETIAERREARDTHHREPVGLAVVGHSPYAEGRGEILAVRGTGASAVTRGDARYLEEFPWPVEG